MVQRLHEEKALLSFSVIIYIYICMYFGYPEISQTHGADVSSKLGPPAEPDNL